MTLDELLNQHATKKDDKKLKDGVFKLDYSFHNNGAVSDETRTYNKGFKESPVNITPIPSFTQGYRNDKKEQFPIGNPTDPLASELGQSLVENLPIGAMLGSGMGGIQALANMVKGYAGYEAVKYGVGEVADLAKEDPDKAKALFDIGMAAIPLFGGFHKVW